MKDKIIYVATKEKNIKKIKNEVSNVAKKNTKYCFLNPVIAFPHFELEELMENSLTLLDMCDEMWVFDETANAYGYETDYCRKYKIPVRIVGR